MIPKHRKVLIDSNVIQESWVKSTFIHDLGFVEFN